MLFQQCIDAHMLYLNLGSHMSLFKLDYDFYSVKSQMEQPCLAQDL